MSLEKGEKEMIFESKASLEATFQSWSKPASDTEETKCENALKIIRDALNKSDELSKYDIQLIPKGSYHNNTNVRLSSDVDIAVKLKDVFFAKYPSGKTDKDYGNISSTYSFAQYRQDVDRAMEGKFGVENIELGNKAITINSNTYRVDADVVPCFEHRRYSPDGTYITGTEFITRNTNDRVINFPEQHYNNGVNKNNQTARRYKKVVRIFKRLRYNMLEKGYDFENISSFLIESLIWNVPDSKFNNPTLTEDVKDCFNFLIEHTSEHEKCKEWGEVSELLYLFHSGRNYTYIDANRFLRDGYAYLF